MNVLSIVQAVIYLLVCFHYNIQSDPDNYIIVSCIFVIKYCINCKNINYYKHHQLCGNVSSCLRKCLQQKERKFQLQGFKNYRKTRKYYKKKRKIEIQYKLEYLLITLLSRNEIRMLSRGFVLLLLAATTFIVNQILTYN